MTDHLQVLTTVASEEDAERISIALVERRLAACVQAVGPIASRYRWQGKVETAREWQCLAKTEAAPLPGGRGGDRRAPSLRRAGDRSRRRSSPAAAGYLAWVSENVG